MFKTSLIDKKGDTHVHYMAVHLNPLAPQDTLNKQSTANIFLNSVFQRNVHTPDV